HGSRVPQEILDVIVDNVAQLHFRSLWSLLKSSRLFGPQCRLHLYREVTIRPLSSQSPFHFHGLIMRYNVGHLVNTLCVHFCDDAQPSLNMICKVMAKLVRLETVVLSEALLSSSCTDPSKMFADLPTSTTVRRLTLSLVRSLSAEHVANVLSAYQNLSSLEVSKCNIDYEDPSATPTAPPVRIALEELSVLDTHYLVSSIFTGSVAPPIISLHKLRRLVVGQTFTPRTWPSYEALFQEIQGPCRKLFCILIQMDFRGLTSRHPETSLFVNVPSLIVVPPFDSDFDFLVDMLVPVAHDRTSRGLKRLALVFDWSMYQDPLWSDLADLLAKLALPFSVCISLAWTSSSRASYKRALSDVQDILDYFEGIERPIRVQPVELAVEEQNFHKESTEFLYY
ncbi:hypothetical protein BDZ89DRAFT_1060997, partial [Hymenopellis radicata]